MAKRKLKFEYSYYVGEFEEDDPAQVDLETEIPADAGVFFFLNKNEDSMSCRPEAVDGDGSKSVSVSDYLFIMESISKMIASQADEGSIPFIISKQILDILEPARDYINGI